MHGNSITKSVQVPVVILLKSLHKCLIFESSVNVQEQNGAKSRNKNWNANQNWIRLRKCVIRSKSTDFLSKCSNATASPCSACCWQQHNWRQIPLHVYGISLSIVHRWISAPSRPHTLQPIHIEKWWNPTISLIHLTLFIELNAFILFGHRKRRGSDTVMDRNKLWFLWAVIRRDEPFLKLSFRISSCFGRVVWIFPCPCFPFLLSLFSFNNQYFNKRIRFQTIPKNEGYQAACTQIGVCVCVFVALVILSWPRADHFNWNSRVWFNQCKCDVTIGFVFVLIERLFLLSFRSRTFIELWNM